MQTTNQSSTDLLQKLAKGGSGKELEKAVVIKPKLNNKVLRNFIKSLRENDKMDDKLIIEIICEIDELIENGKYTNEMIKQD
jgi:hypothetical protein